MDEGLTPGRSERVDPAAFRRALGRFATGVAVVAARDPRGRRLAMTVNAFTSVSLDPPLVLYCLGRSAFHFSALSAAPAFAVNILGQDQQALSDRFAREAEDGFSDLPTLELATGSPVLARSLAALDCTRQARHEAGDHLIVVGRVEALYLQDDGERPGAPLIYYASGYRRLTP